MTLQFSTVLRVGSGYGHDGDGCIAASRDLNEIVSRVSFDFAKKKVRQTNRAWRSMSNQILLSFLTTRARRERPLR